MSSDYSEFAEKTDKLQKELDKCIDEYLESPEKIRKNDNKYRIRDFLKPTIYEVFLMGLALPTCSQMTCVSSSMLGASIPESFAWGLLPQALIYFAGRGYELFGKDYYLGRSNHMKSFLRKQKFPSKDLL